jgi:hypothetical protein
VTRLYTATAPEASLDGVTVRVLRAVTAFVRGAGDAVDYVPVVTFDIARGDERARVQLRPGETAHVGGAEVRLDAMTDVPHGDGEQSAVDVSIRA